MGAAVMLILLSLWYFILCRRCRLQYG